MAISFTCPHCHNTTEVDESYAGQSGPCAQCGATITIPGGASYTPKSSSGSNTIWIVLGACLLIFLVCGGGLAALLIPAIGAAREAARRMECSNNLRQIGIALHNYHDTHKTFPPAFIPDDNGQPMTSWRVMILPFIEQSYLYDQYDFNEPWDSPNNLSVTSMPMPVYQCPSDPGSSCSYFVVDVPGGLFDGPNASQIRSITDGTSNTIMVVEVTGSNVHWAEPRDLGPQALSLGIGGATNGSAISSPHTGGANLVMADGSVHFVDPATTAGILQALITKGDGQPVYLP